MNYIPDSKMELAYELAEHLNVSHTWLLKLPKELLTEWYIKMSRDRFHSPFNTAMFINEHWKTWETQYNLKINLHPKLVLTDEEKLNEINAMFEMLLQPNKVEVLPRSMSSAPIR